MFYLKWIGWTIVLIPATLAGLVAAAVGILILAIVVLGPIFWIAEKLGLSRRIPKVEDWGGILSLLFIFAVIIGYAHDMALDEKRSPVTVASSSATPVAQSNPVVTDAPISQPPAAKIEPRLEARLTAEERSELFQVISSQRDFWRDLATLESLILAAFVGVHFIPRNKQ